MGGSCHRWVTKLRINREKLKGEGVGRRNSQNWQKKEIKKEVGTRKSMGSNSIDGETNEHVIDIWDVNKDRLEAMQLKISENPKLLSKVAGRRSCCIFRVPQSLIDVNGKAYQPRIVSIGPYHHGQPRLAMIEEHKWRYLGSLLSRTKTKGLDLEDYLKAVVPLESEARECYSESIQLSSDEFIEILVVDGCFLIELFRKVGKLVPVESDDPIFTMAWILPYFYRDFLKLENQIPFFILERLFELSKLPEEKSSATLSTLALEFINSSMQKPDQVIAQQSNLQGKHLLDLIRSSYIPTDLKTVEKTDQKTPTHLIHCVSKLRRAGIEIHPCKVDSFLYVTHRNGVIKMPTITIDDFMSSFLLNCVAFELCYSDYSKYFTTYVTLMDCLINTYRDVEYLFDRNIIENHLGTDGEVASFFNNAGKEVVFDIEMCYLSPLFNDVHNYYRNSWHVQWASFKHTYFETPWSFISALAALLLLILTLGQTYFAGYQFFAPSDSES